MTRILRFIVILCSGLVFGLTLTHVLQAPGSRGLSAAEWLHVQHAFYGGFAVVGGIGELLGLAAALALFVVCAVGKKPGQAIVATVVAVCLAATLAAFFVGNQPVNAQVSEWTPATIPSDWRTLRDTWEASHLVSACLSGVAFVIALAAAIWSGARRRGIARAPRS